MEYVGGVLLFAAAGAVVGPVALGVLGFSAVGPVAGSVAAMGIGGVGGGAAWGFATVQSIAMVPLMATKVGAVAGAVAGVARTFL